MARGGRAGGVTQGQCDGVLNQVVACDVTE